jgi:hypothetical protein
MIFETGGKLKAEAWCWAPAVTNPLAGRKRRRA